MTNQELSDSNWRHSIAHGERAVGLSHREELSEESALYYRRASDALQELDKVACMLCDRLQQAVEMADQCWVDSKADMRKRLITKEREHHEYVDSLHERNAELVEANRNLTERSVSLGQQIEDYRRQVARLEKTLDSAFKANTEVAHQVIELQNQLANSWPSTIKAHLRRWFTW